MKNPHELIEKNVGLLTVLILVAISFGAMVQITPLMFQQQTMEPVTGLRPYTALELEGRDIYIREGCVGCHSQMIRPFRAETESGPDKSVPCLPENNPRQKIRSVPCQNGFTHGPERIGVDLSFNPGRYRPHGALWAPTCMGPGRDLAGPSCRDPAGTGPHRAPWPYRPQD